MLSQLLPLEFRLLEFFVRNRSNWFSTEELISRVWSMNSTATPDSVRASIKRLRSTLEEIGLDQYLESARNRGYRLQ